ncbi:MAG: hypothetical protein ACRD5J_07665 [Nitrososphaeraceae archaeon]
MRSNEIEEIPFAGKYAIKKPGAGSSRPFNIGSLEDISRVAKESASQTVRALIERLETRLFSSA